MKENEKNWLLTSVAVFHICLYLSGTVMSNYFYLCQILIREDGSFLARNVGKKTWYLFIQHRLSNLTISRFLLS